MRAVLGTSTKQVADHLNRQIRSQRFHINFVLISFELHIFPTQREAIFHNALIRNPAPGHSGYGRAAAGQRPGTPISFRPRQTAPGTRAPGLWPGTGRALAAPCHRHHATNSFNQPWGKQRPGSGPSSGWAPAGPRHATPRLAAPATPHHGATPPRHEFCHPTLTMGGTRHALAPM